VSICVRAGLSKPRPVPDTERNKGTKTLDYASTPLDANTLLWAVRVNTTLFSYTDCYRPLFFSLPNCHCVKVDVTCPNEQVQLLLNFYEYVEVASLAKFN
jgi:hypothetical protein